MSHSNLKFFAEMRHKLGDPVFAAKFAEVLQEQGEVGALFRANMANRGRAPTSFPPASKAAREAFTMGRLVGELKALYEKKSPSHEEVVRMNEILEALKGYMSPEELVALVEELSSSKVPLTGVYGYGSRKYKGGTRKARRGSRKGTRRN